MFKAIRVGLLLLVLVTVALGSWRTRTHSVEWKYDLPVNIYLINGDGSEASADYLKALTLVDFKPVEVFMREEAARHDQASSEGRMGDILATQSPTPPINVNYHLEY